MYLSVLIPVYNEVDNVRPLCEAILQSLEDVEEEFEVIFVDDGSDDGTLAVLEGLVDADPRVRTIKLRKNFGQTIAMRVGFEHARGEMIVTMDGDMQNDPRDIPMMVKELSEGHDVVAGWRRHRNDPFFSRKLPSKLANWIIRGVTHVPIHDTGCSLKAFRADVVKQLPMYSDMHRFIPAISTMATDRFAEVVVRHHPRRHGKSKYGLTRIAKVVPDLLTLKMLISFSQRPLHWFGGWAMAVLVLSLLTGLLAAYRYVAAGDTSAIVLPTVALLLGYLAVHLLLAGIFGELVVRAEPSGRIEPLVDLAHIPARSSS